MRSWRRDGAARRPIAGTRRSARSQSASVASIRNRRALLGVSRGASSRRPTSGQFVGVMLIERARARWDRMAPRRRPPARCYGPRCEGRGASGGLSVSMTRPERPGPPSPADRRRCGQRPDPINRSLLPRQPPGAEHHPSRAAPQQLRQRPRRGVLPTGLKRTDPSRQNVARYLRSLPPRAPVSPAHSIL
jgi:hypothetical protein